MITKIKEDGFFILLGIITLVSAGFVMAIMTIMVDNMTNIL